MLSVFTPPPQNYESLLAEAKMKRESYIAEAVEKAVTSEMQDIQSKLDKYTEEKNALAEVCLTFLYKILHALIYNLSDLLQFQICGHRLIAIS